MRVVPTNLVRFLAGVVLVVGSGSLSACGDEPVAQDQAETPAHRARRVAAAWDGSAAAAQWRAGYHPMGEVTQAPRGGLHSSADKTAYRERRFVLTGTLPTGSSTNGRVAWGDEVSLTRPLRGAQESYDLLNRAGAGGSPHLTVTGARLGEMSVATSRGPAVVPAWLFRLEGYDAPLKRAAAVPSALPRPPIGPVSGPAWIERLVEVNGRSVTVVFSHGVCDEGFDVNAYETRGSVVLFVVVRKPQKHGLCTKQAVSEQAMLQLEHPLDDRVLLGALTGKPVRYRPEHGRSALSGS